MGTALRLLRYIPQSIIAVALVAAALFFQPWVLIDPIDRFTNLNGPSRSMIPGVFAEGESLVDATRRLASSGYTHVAVEPAVDGFTHFFRKSDVAFSVACGLHYVVWLRSEEERVVAAQSDVQRTCL